MFLFGLRDLDLIGRILRIVLLLAAGLLLAFLLLPPIAFFSGGLSLALLSAS